jgi:beta-alanine--pyruvate transaminase
LVRAAGDNLVLCPAFTVDKAQIEQMVGTLADSIRRHA